MPPCGRGDGSHRLAHHDPGRRPMSATMEDFKATLSERLKALTGSDAYPKDAVLIDELGWEKHGKECLLAVQKLLAAAAKEKPRPSLDWLRAKLEATGGKPRKITNLTNNLASLLKADIDDAMGGH